MLTTLGRVVAFKQTVIGIGEVIVLGLGIWQLVVGNWILGALILFVGSIAWYIAADLMTALLVAPFVGIAAFRDRRRKD